MHKSLMCFGIDFIDPDNAEALFAIKAHLCVVLCCSVPVFSILNSLVWRVTQGVSAKPR